MQIYSITSPEFEEYGRVVEGYDDEKKELVCAMKEISLPGEGTAYGPAIAELESTRAYKTLGASMYGGLPVQFGCCYGYNTRMNCLEYHRDSEFNLGDEDFILLLAKESDIVNGNLDTAKVKAFRVPAGVLVEVYSTSLHYAPCHANAKKGFRVLAALPRGTNTQKPEIECKNGEDAYLWACNKWLLAHPGSAEAAQGAKIALLGENIDIEDLL